MSSTRVYGFARPMSRLALVVLGRLAVEGPQGSNMAGFFFSISSAINQLTISIAGIKNLLTKGVSLCYKGNGHLSGPPPARRIPLLTTFRPGCAVQHISFIYDGVFSGLHVGRRRPPRPLADDVAANPRQPRIFKKSGLADSCVFTLIVDDGDCTQCASMF
jgi:hypothetical protein